MSPFTWAVILIILGQFPAYLARETLRLAIMTIGTALERMLTEACATRLSPT